ncbi:MAG: OmpA family protein [Lewinellaceae bacterium]|nr:OmpA family protein [Lewinellaceae bacterium]
MLLLRSFFYTVFLLLPLFSAAQSGTMRVILSTIEFSANKTSVNAAGRQELDEVAALLKATPAITAEIGAHTDASGSASYNLKLSRSRATAVRTYLVGKGITAKRLTARGYGETKPLNRCGRGARCSDAEKRKNRRVELLLRNLPADSVTRAPWLALGGLAPKKPLVQPDVPKVKPTVSPGAPAQAAAGNALPPTKRRRGAPLRKATIFPN